MTEREKLQAERDRARDECVRLDAECDLAYTALGKHDRRVDADGDLNEYDRAKTRTPLVAECIRIDAECARAYTALEGYDRVAESPSPEVSDGNA